MSRMQVGVWLPSFTWPRDNTWEPAHYLKEWSIKCDHAGIDIWEDPPRLHVAGLPARARRGAKRPRR